MANQMDIPTDEYTIPIGKAKVIREGRHASLISYSRMIKFCDLAAKELAKRGFEIEIIDLRTIKPLDIATRGCVSSQNTSLCSRRRGTSVCRYFCGTRVSDHGALFRFPGCSNREGLSA